jgi:aspartate racemase
MESRLKGVRRVGLIATTGTVQAGIFQKSLSRIGKELVLPTSEIQEKNVMKAIYGKDGIKAIGSSKTSKRLILQASQTLIRRGAQAIIAGCTEIPLVLREGDLSVPVIDPLTILARSAVAKAKGKHR